MYVVSKYFWVKENMKWTNHTVIMEYCQKQHTLVRPPVTGITKCVFCRHRDSKSSIPGRQSRV
jgi:hypothetical protein